MKGLPHPWILFAIWLIGLLSIIPMTLVLQSVFPRFLRRASDALERGRGRCFLTGFMGMLILMVAAARLASVKPVFSILWILIAILLAFGLTVVFRTMGGRMYFSMNSPRADLAWPSTLLGGTVLWMSSLLPILGQLVLTICSVFGLGGVLIALFSRSAKPQSVPPVLPKM